MRRGAKSPAEYTGRGRIVLLWVGGILLCLMTLVLIPLVLLTAQLSIKTVSTFLQGQSDLSTTDRLSLIAAEVAAATFLLAVLAAVFAILAYAVSTRTPNIEVSFVFPGCAPNKPVVSRGAADANPGIPLQTRAGAAGPLSAAVMLISKNRWTAEHLLLRVWLSGMTLPATWSSQHWDKDYATPAGSSVEIFQLREPYPRVYGQIPAHVWPIDFTNLRLASPNPVIVYFVTAHGGYLRIKKIPVVVE
jgi:hypothetical protein